MYSKRRDLHHWVIKLNLFTCKVCTVVLWVIDAFLNDTLSLQSVKTRSAWKAVRSPMTRLLLPCTPTSIMLPTAPGYTIKKEQALGQLPLVHTGFRLIFVPIHAYYSCGHTGKVLLWPVGDHVPVTMEWHSSITNIDKPLLRWNRPSLQFFCFHSSPVSRSFSRQVNTLYNNLPYAIKNTLLNQKLTAEVWLPPFYFCSFVCNIKCLFLDKL